MDSQPLPSVQPERPNARPEPQIIQGGLVKNPETEAELQRLQGEGWFLSHVHLQKLDAEPTLVGLFLFRRLEPPTDLQIQDTRRRLSPYLGARIVGQGRARREEMECHGLLLAP